MAREDVHAMLSQDFVLLKIDQDRTIGGQDIKQERFAESTSSGIPWFAFLEPSGEVVVTSSLGGKNVGCPWTDAELASFGKILASACVKLGEEQRDALIDSLAAYRDEVEQARKKAKEEKEQAKKRAEGEGASG